MENDGYKTDCKEKIFQLNLKADSSTNSIGGYCQSQYCIFDNKYSDSALAEKV